MKNQDIIKKYFDVFRLNVSKRDTVIESKNMEK